MSAPGIVIESDMFADVDDVGAVAVALSLEARHRCRLLGIGINTPSRWGPLAARAIVDFAGADTPIGRAVAAPPDTIWTPDYARLLGSRVGDALFDPAPLVLRRILERADEPVTIVSIGFFRNLVELLESEGGRELVRERVGRCVVMGGAFPEGEEFNISEHPHDTSAFLRLWPGRIDFVGFETADDVITGRRTSEQISEGNPLRLAYEAYCGPGVGRPSWDPLTVLLAVDADSSIVTWSAPGTLRMEGRLGSWSDDPAGAHRYAIRAAQPREIEGLIDAEFARFDALGAG
jgi:purine nucleosidase